MMKTRRLGGRAAISDYLAGCDGRLSIDESPLVAR